LSSKQLSRKHIVEDMGNGFVSLLGGKWTSYRAMGEHCVNEIVKNYEFQNLVHPKSTSTQFKLLGSYTKQELDGIMTMTND
jgi:glycerol-3-phosphate dehydrogenase